jgi:hypothetical protein
MKVRVVLSVDVDAELWARYGGCEEGAAAVRDDVREYILNQVQGAALVEEAEGSVELRETA